MAPPKLLKAKEVAPVLRVSVWQVAALCREGKIRATRPGGQWLIAEEDLDAYIRAGASRARGGVVTSNEYRLRTGDLAAEFELTPDTVRKKAKALGIGIDLGGRAGFRYSDLDRQRLIESMRPPAPIQRRRRRRAA